MGELAKHTLRGLDDIRRIIAQTPKPDITPDAVIQLGPRGMGMPVLQSYWRLMEMAPGQVLGAESGHP